MFYSSNSCKFADDVRKWAVLPIFALDNNIDESFVNFAQYQNSEAKDSQKAMHKSR